MEGHINISEVLNGNQKLPSTNLTHTDAHHQHLMMDSRSHNSQDMMSQYSNDLDNG